MKIYDGVDKQYAHEPEDDTIESVAEVTDEKPDLVAEAQKDAAHFKDQWIRAVAELDNIRKRSAREREDTLKYAITKFAQDILSVSDNMARALDACPAHVSHDLGGMIDGIRMTQSELENTLSRHGIKKLSPLGEMFNPNFHQAMFEVPMDTATLPVEDGQEPKHIVSGMVVQVVQSGYMIHDRLLRPALVGIAKE